MHPRAALSEGKSMDHVLTEHGLRLTYLCDRNAIAAVDQDLLLEDLTGDETPPWPLRYRLTDCDHLVLVSDQTTGRYLAVLAASDGTTPQEDFLLLETAFVASAARGQNLMRRMIAFALLRIGGLRSAPSVIAMCTRNPLCYRIMRGAASRFTGAVMFPAPDNVVVDFHAAALAQRIARAIKPNHRFHAATSTIRGAVLAATGTDYLRPLSHDRQIDDLFGQTMQPADRMLALIDLRRLDEATILGDARRIYRSR